MNLCRKCCVFSAVNKSSAVTKTKAQKFDFEKSRKKKSGSKIMFKKIKSSQKDTEMFGKFHFKEKNLYLPLRQTKTQYSRHIVKKWLATSKSWLEVSWEKRINSSSKEELWRVKLFYCFIIRRKLLMQTSQLDYLWMTRLADGKNSFFVIELFWYDALSLMHFLLRKLHSINFVVKVDNEKRPIVINFSSQTSNISVIFAALQTQNLPLGGG